MTWWGNWGPLMAQWKILGPFMTQWGNWKHLIKQWGNCVGEAKWPDGETGKMGPWWRNGTFGALWWSNGQIRDPSNGEVWALDDLMEILDHELFSNDLIRFHCTLSKLWAPNFNWEILHDMQVEKKNTWGPIFRLIFQRSSDDYQCLILVFSVIYLDLWGYIGWGPRPGIWKVSFPLFNSSFSFLFFSLCFFSFVSFLGPTLAPGHPGHRPPMPPSCYATDTYPPPHPESWTGHTLPGFK